MNKLNNLVICRGDVTYNIFLKSLKKTKYLEVIKV